MILQAEHIAKSFGKKEVLQDVSFELKKGTVTGIEGENGAGKTVLLEILLGLRKAQKGKVYLTGSVGYCPQKSLLFPELTVKEHFQYFSVAYGIDSKTSFTRAEELMQHFHFTKYFDQKIEKLSGGTQQKLNLSIALLHQPDVLILDEPYSGFDWETYLRFWEYSSDIKNQGRTILIVTHFLRETEKLDRIYQLKNGVLS